MDSPAPPARPANAAAPASATATPARSASQATPARSAAPTGTTPTPATPRPPVTDGWKPCAIMMTSGLYKGQWLDLGLAQTESSSEQTADWPVQDGRAMRLGATFKSISSRTFSLSVEFYSLEEDVSIEAENLTVLHQIDPETGMPPLLIYREGKIDISPVKCNSLKISKDTPFMGDKGFRHAKVDLVLELIGGRSSEHRFAKPLVETALTRWLDQTTAAERARQGAIATATQLLAQCLTAEENEQIKTLLEGNQAGDAQAVGRLSPSALIQASVGGIIPPSTLARMGDKLRQDLAIEMARKTDGVGTNAPSLALAILGQTPTTPLPPDLQTQVESLRADHQSILAAITTQQLDTNSPVFSRGTTSDRLQQTASCGLRLRNSAPNASGQSNPQTQAFFQSRLNDRAADPAAQEQLIVTEINTLLGDQSKTDADIQAALAINDPQVIAAIRNGRPYRSKAEFIERFGAQSQANGLSSWTSFIDSLASAPSSGSPTNGIAPAEMMSSGS